MYDPFSSDNASSNKLKVCVLGYSIIGLALILFVQAHNIYPQLLLGRLLFSLGAAAASTMVTAVLPTVSLPANVRVAKEAAPTQQRCQTEPTLRLPPLLPRSQPLP